MTTKSLEARVLAIEVQLAGKTLDQHFREQAELIDRLLIYRLDEMDKRWDAKFDAKLDAKLRTLENSLEMRLEAKLEAKLEPLRSDLGAIKDTVRVILARLP